MSKVAVRDHRAAMTQPAAACVCNNQQQCTLQDSCYWSTSLRYSRGVHACQPIRQHTSCCLRFLPARFFLALRRVLSSLLSSSAALGAPCCWALYTSSGARMAASEATCTHTRTSLLTLCLFDTANLFNTALLDMDEPCCTVLPAVHSRTLQSCFL